MRYGRHRYRSLTLMTFNATPMVDVFFLLTIFFMLVTRFSSAEQVPMELPKPAESKAGVVRMPERVVINCRLADTDDPDGPSVLYSIGPNPSRPLAVIAEQLAGLKRESSGLKVVLRADKRLPYSDVRAVMRVIADNRIEVLNVVAHVAEKL